MLAARGFSLFFLCSLLVSAAPASLQLWGFPWSVPVASDWSITEELESPVLHLLIGKEPASTQPRRPVQFALAEAGPFRRVTLTTDIQPLQRSMILVYGYQDAAHFDYAHLSTDTAVSQPNHNGIFHVFGGERVRISSLAGPPAFPDGHRWYHVTLNWDGATGEVQVTVDGVVVPALHAVDLSLQDGKVGLGSFDETGNFRHFTLHGGR